MVEGNLILAGHQIMVNNYVIYRNQMGGFYQQGPGIKIGICAQKGQLLSRVIDPVMSEVQEECRSPVNGIIISHRIRMLLNPGGYIAQIADTDAISWERKDS